MFKVNDDDLYSLIKEEVDFDPSKTESMAVALNVNDKKVSNGSETLEWACLGIMPWIIDDIDEKIQNALGTENLRSIYIHYLECKPWVANEFLDLLTCQDLPEHGLEKLICKEFLPECEPFEEDVVSRLANMCLNISHL